MLSAKSERPSPIIATFLGREAMSILTNITPADPSRLNDPDHWRGKATEARIKADEMKDSVARKTMQSVIDNYEGLAAQVEARRAASASDAL
jgi:hypothetical protein